MAHIIFYEMDTEVSTINFWSGFPGTGDQGRGTEEHIPIYF